MIDIRNIKTHAGRSIPSDWDFFAPPPLQIGEILTAQTSLKKGKKHIEPSTRAIIIMMISMFGFLIGWYITRLANLSPQDSQFHWYYLLMIGLPLIGLWIGFIVTKFYHCCTYVGAEGIAEFILSKNRNNIPEQSVFLFDSADLLYVRETDHYTKGTYRNTTYAYVWKSEKNDIIYCIDGSYSEEHAKPKNLNDRYYFALSAEEAWQKYKLPKIIEMGQQLGKAKFCIRNFTVELGEDIVNIYKDGKLVWNIKDVDFITVENKKMVIYHKKYQDIGWLSKLFGAGKISFAYADVPNAQIFLLIFKLLTK